MDESLSRYLPRLSEDAKSVLKCGEFYKKLESSIFNSISLGQWESARASFKCLALSEDSSVRDACRELLKILVLEAASYWTESTAIPSPHHLSWLALDAYKSFFPDENDQLPEYIEKLIEFRLLLYLSRGVLSFSVRVASMLCQYHAAHILKIPGTTSSSFETVSHLPNLLISYLHDVITILNPTLGHTLITNLTVTSGGSQYVHNNEALQFVYLDCISECLEVLDGLKVEDKPGNDSDSQYESDHASSGVHLTGTECEKAVSMVYLLLSMINSSPEMIRLTKKVDTLFHTLLQASYRVGPGGDPVTFEVGRIYGCLLGRSNTFLISRLQEVEEFLRLNRTTDESYGTSSPVGTTRQGHLTPQRPQAVDEKVGVADMGTPLPCSDVVQAEWKNRFYNAMFDHKHLLEAVLDRGLHLIYTGKLQELSALMMKPEFIPLRPVLLLLGWDRYASTGSGKELLDVLWPMEVSMKQSLMFNGCCKLAFQVELVQWCLDKARPHLQSSFSHTFHRAGDMFKGLKNYSTLYVLHHSTPLGALDPLEVVDILKMRPRIPSRSSLLSPPPQFSRGTTPMKVSSESETSPGPAPLPPTIPQGGGHLLFTSLKQAELKPEQERDIAIFRSFCAMKLIFNAIWSSVQLRNASLFSAREPTCVASVPVQSEPAATDKQHSGVAGSGGGASSSGGSHPQKPHAKAARKLDLGSEVLTSALDDQNIEDPTNPELNSQETSNKIYHRDVTERFLEARSYLGNIFPLNYRLEVLENIFSLLLLGSDDIRQKSAVAGQPFTSSTPVAVKGGMSSFVSLLKGKHEFLMDERLASELLDVLQDCIRELRAAKYAQSQQSGATSGEPNVLPSNTVRCSISESSLKSRTTKLEQYVNEARWRLQMVSPKQGIMSMPPMGGVGSSHGRGLFSSSEEEEEEESPSGASEEESGEGERELVGRRKKRKRPSLVSKDDGSGSISSFSSSKADSITRSNSVKSHTQRRSAGGGGRKASPSYAPGHTPGHTPPPSVLSSTQPAPRPVSFAGLHSVRSSPKAKKSIAKQNSLSSVTSKPSEGRNSSTSTVTHKKVVYLEEDSWDADVEEHSPALSSTRRRKRLRSRESLTSRKRRLHSFPEQSGANLSRRNSIVCWMLASSDSLLRMCLKHSNYMRASEVLKILHMEGQFGEALIRFSEQYEAVSKQLTQQSRSGSNTPLIRRSPASAASSSRSSAHISHSSTPPRPTSTSNLALEQSHPPNMNLQVAIMNARSSFDPLQCVYQLLAPSSIQQVLFSGDAKLEALVQESELLRRLMNHVPSLVMLDLACSNKISGHIAVKLLEAALDRLQSDLSTFQDTHGPFVMLKFMSDVSSHFPQTPTSFRHAQTLVPPPHTSPHSLLTHSTHLLTPASVFQVKFFLDAYRDAREKLEAEMDLSATELYDATSSKSPDIFDQLTQLVSEEAPRTPTSPLRHQTPPNGNILNELIRALHSIPPKHAFQQLSSSPGNGAPLQPSAGPAHQSGGVMMENNAVSYLWQFSRYISKLTELLVKCLNIKSSNVGKGSMILSVLKESPSHTLGRLIFERGIHPQKLEGMMGDFPHLRIVEVLIKCCCPELPSLASPVKSVVPSAAVVPLNVGECSAQIDDPCAFSHKLLTDLLEALKGMSTMQSSLQDSVLTTRELASAYNDSRIQEVLKETPSLASVDLSKLNSLTKQMVFYTNILNCLYVHTLMYCCSSVSEMGVASGKVGVALPVCGRGIDLSMVECSRVLQMALFTKVGYHVGELGLISCHDLHHSFLRRGLAPPTVVKDTGLQPRLALTQPDHWLDHAPTAPDPRLFYVLHDGLMGSPQPFPLSVESFETALSAAERRYLNTNVSIDAAKREVTVPKALFNNRKDFRKLYQTDGLSSSQAKQSEMTFFRYIQSNIETKADILLTLIETSETAKTKRLQLIVQPEDMRLGYDFSSQHLSTSVVVSPGGSPKTRRKRLTREPSRKEFQSVPTAGDVESGGAQTRRNSFTAETLGFVNKRAPLLASLVSLSCSTDTSARPRPEEGVAEEDRDTPTSRDRGGGGEEGRHTRRSRVMSPPPVGSSPRVAKMTGVFDERELTPWKRQYNEVLSHFVPYRPLCKYLTARLHCFAELVPWDQAKPTDSLSNSLRSPEPLTEITEGVNLRTLALASASSEELAVACTLVMKKLVETKQIGAAVQFLSSEPALGNLPEVRLLGDIALSCYFVEHHRNVSVTARRKRRSLLGDEAKDSSSASTVINPVPILSQLSDPELAARLTLASLPDWPVDTCADMLGYCLHHLPAGSLLSTPLAGKLERMRVYARIMAKCENPMSYQWNTTRAPWKSWADLAKDSETKTDYVLRVLLESKEYDLAREWCAVHKLGSSVQQQIEVDYLFDLLEGGTPNPILAHQKLDSLPDARASLEVCEALLHEKNKKCGKPNVELMEADLKTVIFILEYVLSRLSVSIAKRSEYCRRLLGAKALLSLPKSSYDQYKQLMQYPFLLVEQLIMDLKIDWASSVIRQLRSNKHLQGVSNMDIPILDHTPMIGDEEGVTSDPFSVVLIFYCTKALDFPQPILIQSTPAHSLLQTINTTTSPSPTIGHPGGARVPPTPGRNISGGGGMSVDPQLDDFGQYPPMTPRRPSGFRNRAGSSTMTASEPPAPQAEGFQPPSEPPPREKWEKDDETKICRICKVHFGMFMRRHHCRRCGRVVCAGCSSHVLSVKGYDRPVRTCDTCHNVFSPQASSSGPGGENANGNKPEGGANGASHAQDLHPSHLLSLNLSYKLVPNDLLYNQNMRGEFYYERTPNTALCLSLADLLLSKRQAAGVILDCCHTVSAQLVPDSQGRINEEIDHHFVISLIQSLLLNAKLRFAEASDSSGVELCDTYLSRVDLLRLLVSARYNKIPSIQELTKPDLARRVRDGLIKADRFGLAMEVSTKCQLDTRTVWSAWGKACLMSGEFIEARSKLKHCFQISSQSKMLGSGGTSGLLQRIVEQIETRPLSTAGRTTRLSEDWSGVVLGSTSITQRHSESGLDQVRFNECIYYLSTYGTHSSCVNFFIRHSCFREACRFILDNNCASDVFVDQLWVPTLKSGQADHAIDCMKELDPSLGAWQPHLTAACRLFSKKLLFSVLLLTQIYMNDYVRAGLTCIKFFIGFSGRFTTIADLFGHLHYLDQASTHFHRALSNKAKSLERGRGFRLRGQRAGLDESGGARGGIKSANESELRGHLDTIALQKRVISHLYESAQSKGTLKDPLGGGGGADFKSASPSPTATPSQPHPHSSGQQPPTLFSNTHIRGEVATQVIISSHDLAEGFAIAKELIEHFKLNSKQVLCDTSRGLAMKQCYGEIRNLIQCIQKTHSGKTGISFEVLNDEIIMAAIRVLASQSKEAKQVDKLVQMLISDRSKINGYVQCGKLKNAYLVAIKAKLVDEVQKISEIAFKAGQLSVRDICEKWLQSNSSSLRSRPTNRM